MESHETKRVDILTFFFTYLRCQRDPHFPLFYTLSSNCPTSATTVRLIFHERTEVHTLSHAHTLCHVHVYALYYSSGIVSVQDFHSLSRKLEFVYFPGLGWRLGRSQGATPLSHVLSHSHGSAGDWSPRTTPLPYVPSRPPRGHTGTN